MARGSIVERSRANGETAFAIKYRTGDGTQVFKTIGTNRRAAERALTAALAAVDRGDLNGVTRETFGGYAERWLADHRGRVEHATAIDYENSLRNHLLPVLGAIRLSAIRPEHMRAYAAGKRDGSAAIAVQPKGKGGRIQRVLAPKTINNHLTLLSLILGHAVADGLIPSNPASSRDSRRPIKLKVPHREQDYLRPGEVPIYLRGCSPFWRIRALTLILTGCRIGELLALEPDDIDWHGNAIIIKRAMKAGRLIGSTKGDETGRRVDMGPALAAALREAGSAASVEAPAGGRASSSSPLRRADTTTRNGSWSTSTARRSSAPACARRSSRTSSGTRPRPSGSRSASRSNTCGGRWAIATSRRRSGTTGTSSAR